MLYSIDFLDEATFNASVYVNNTFHYSKIDWAYDMWQQLDLSSEIQSKLCDLVDLGRNSVAVDMKMVGSVFNEKLSFKMLGFFSSKLD